MKVDGKHIDILLLDYRLGDMSGDEVARKIMGMNGTKVILISAFEMDSSFGTRIGEPEMYCFVS